MKSNCNIKGLAGLNDPFLPDKAKRINAALKKMAAPFYQVCSSLPDKSSKDSKKLSWRRYSPSCIDGYTNARWCSDKEVDAFLQKNYNVALSTFERNPEKYSDAKPLEKKPTKRELDAQKKSERAAKAKATREARKAEELRKEEERKAKREARKNAKMSVKIIPDSGEMIPVKVGTGLFPRHKEYEIFRKRTSNGAERYSFINSKGVTMSMTKSDALKYLDKYNAAHPRKAEIIETDKPKADVQPVLPPPVQAKTYELKKFATNKPYKSETKNSDFLNFAEVNFKKLKQDYTDLRRSKQLPGNIKDFQDYALSMYKRSIEIKKENEQAEKEKAERIRKREEEAKRRAESMPDKNPVQVATLKTGGDYSALKELLKQAMK